MSPYVYFCLCLSISLHVSLCLSCWVDLPSEPSPAGIMWKVSSREMSWPPILNIYLHTYIYMCMTCDPAPQTKISTDQLRLSRTWHVVSEHLSESMLEALTSTEARTRYRYSENHVQALIQAQKPYFTNFDQESCSSLDRTHGERSELLIPEKLIQRINRACHHSRVHLFLTSEINQSIMALLSTEE